MTFLPPPRLYGVAEIYTDSETGGGQDTSLVTSVGIGRSPGLPTGADSSLAVLRNPSKRFLGQPETAITAFRSWLLSEVRKLYVQHNELKSQVAQLDAQRRRKEEIVNSLDKDIERRCGELSAAQSQQLVPHATRYQPPYIAALEWVKCATNDLADERLGEFLGVSRQALHLWRQGEPIRASNRRRLLAVRDVLERAADRVGTGERLATWLDTPCRSDGRTPAQLLIAGDLDAARYVAMGGSSAAVLGLPDWVIVTQAAGGEILAEGLPPWYDREVSGLSDGSDEFVDPEPEG